MSGHHHHHHHHHHPHDDHRAPRRALLLALSLTLGFAGVEAAAGLWSGSLALLGDAGHMLTDSLALGLAALAAWFAARPPSTRHSYGLGRMETLAALGNALLMVALVALIAAEAVERLQSPRPVHGGAVTAVALVGLAVNVAAAWLLSGDRHNLNVRAALIHVLGDLLGSVAALVSGVVILYTDWTAIDPMLSLLIVGLILLSSLRVLREALHALLEGVPLHLDLERIGHAMAEAEGVVSVHDLHVWSISGSRTALSAHVVIGDMASWDAVLRRLETLLQDRFGIGHLTLQPEPTVRFVGIESLGVGRRP